MTDFSIRRIDDNTIYDLFEKARKAATAALESSKEAEELNGRNHEISVGYSSSLPWKISAKDLKEAPANQFVIQRATLNFKTEGGTNHQTKVETVSFAIVRGNNGSLLDTFTVSSPNQIAAMNGTGEQEVQRSIYKALSSVLQPVSPEDGGLIPALTNLAAGFDTAYKRIAGELSASVAAVSKERSDQISEFQEERRRLAQETASEKRSMQETMDQELENERNKISDEREALAEEWAKLKISSHKDARHRQFAEIQEHLLESMRAPVPSIGARATRWAIFLALIVAGVAAGVFAYASILTGSSLDAEIKTTGNLVFAAIRSVTLTLASVGGFIAAASWLRYFYNRDLQSQEELQRFRNDMARASWIMDASMEIRKEHGEDIPEEWLSGVTQGLFSQERGQGAMSEGAQALAALLGLSASASFGPNGPSVQFGKKGGKAMADAAKEAGK